MAMDFGVGVGDWSLWTGNRSGLGVNKIWLHHLWLKTFKTRDGHGFRSRLRQDSAFFSEPGSNIFEKLDPDHGALLIFDISRCLRGLDECHFLGKTLLNFGCTDRCRSLNKSWFVKFQKFRTRCQRNFWLAKFLTSRHVRMQRAIFYISNTLRKLLIRAQGLVFW